MVATTRLHAGARVVGVPWYVASMARITSASACPCPNIAMTSRLTSKQVLQVVALPQPVAHGARGGGAPADLDYPTQPGYAHPYQEASSVKGSAADTFPPIVLTNPPALE